MEAPQVEIDEPYSMGMLLEQMERDHRVSAPSSAVPYFAISPLLAYQVFAHICNYESSYKDPLPLDQMFSKQARDMYANAEWLDHYTMWYAMTLVCTLPFHHDEEIPFVINRREAGWLIELLLNRNLTEDLYDWTHETGGKRWTPPQPATDTDDTPPPSKS